MCTVQKNRVASSKNGEIISSNIIFPKLTDLKYITVKIDEIKSNITGTNETLNKSTSVFVFKDIISRTSLSNNNISTTWRYY